MGRLCGHGSWLTHEGSNRRGIGAEDRASAGVGDFSGIGGLDADAIAGSEGTENLDAADGVLKSGGITSVIHGICSSLAGIGNGGADGELGGWGGGIEGARACGEAEKLTNDCPVDRSTYHRQPPFAISVRIECSLLCTSANLRET